MKKLPLPPVKPVGMKVVVVEGVIAHKATQFVCVMSLKRRRGGGVRGFG